MTLGFFSFLGLLFIGLKLAHIIDWSWILVTLPLWGGAALWVFLFVICVGAVALAAP